MRKIATTQATCDLNGCFRGKRVEVAAQPKLEKSGIRMPMPSIGVDICGTDTPGLIDRG